MGRFLWKIPGDDLFEGMTRVRIDREMKSRIQLDPYMLLGLIIERHFERIRSARVIEEDEVFALPKRGVMDEFLKADELQVVNIQPGLLFCLAQRGLLDPLAQLHMPAGDHVFARPFMA